MPICRIIGALVLFSALSGTLHAQELSQEKDFNIPPESLAKAVIQFSDQSGIQVVTAGQDVSKLTTEGVKGTLKIREALKTLLNGTHLGYSVVGSSTVALVNLASSANAVTPGSESSSPARSETAGINEIIVTAQKKNERLLDVPVPVTVVDTEALANSGAGRIQDYFATVPGLSLLSVASGGGTQYITLRGLSTTSSGGPTVATVIDDVPFGLSTGLNLGQFSYPDIDPSDLARIEVLKGPQGTLYGADSLGGLIKVVTRDPSTEALSGRVQVLSQDIPEGGLGYAVRGSVNIPISDTFAVRASAFARRDPGFIENITTGEDNVNSANAYGARLGALWHASDGISLKLGAMLQNTQGFGTAQINTSGLLQPTLADLQQTGLPGTGRYNTQMQLYTAKLTANFGGLNFVSVSGYGINKWSNLLDFSADAPIFVTPFFPGVDAASYPQTSKTEKFSQEFRLSASVGPWIDWLAGAFYTHEDAPLYQNINANDAATGAYLGTAYAFSDPLTYYEYAIFGDLTVHITDRFDVQVGGREAWNHQIFNSTTAGAAQMPALAGPTLRADGTAFTYLVTPEFKISPDRMVYARIATGYRVGGPNFAFGQLGVPQSYKPDTTTNYDLGFKASFLNHLLTLDASAYYIDWKDIQLGVSPTGSDTCSCYYQVNGARAKSEGLELSLEAHPAQGTTARATGSFNNAALTRDLPPDAVAAGAYGLAGARLPYSVRTSASLGIDQDIVHFADATGFVGADIAYVSARESEFASSAASPRQQFPGYTTVNLHSGVHYEQWLFNLFANNIGDRRGIIGGGPSFSINNPPGYSATVIQPRTIGISVSRDF